MSVLRKLKKLVGVAQENKGTIAEKVDKHSNRFDEQDVEKAVDKSSELVDDTDGNQRNQT